MNCASFICVTLGAESSWQYLSIGISHWCIAGQSLRDTCKCSCQRCWSISWTWDTPLCPLHIHLHLNKKEDRWKYNVFTIPLKYHFYSWLHTLCIENNNTKWETSRLNKARNICIHSRSLFHRPWLVFISEQNHFMCSVQCAVYNEHELVSLFKEPF